MNMTVPTGLPGPPAMSIRWQFKKNGLAPNQVMDTRPFERSVVRSQQTPRASSVNGIATASPPAEDPRAAQTPA